MNFGRDTGMEGGSGNVIKALEIMKSTDNQEVEPRSRFFLLMALALCSDIKATVAWLGRTPATRQAAIWFVGHMAGLGGIGFDVVDVEQGDLTVPGIIFKKSGGKIIFAAAGEELHFGDSLDHVMVEILHGEVSTESGPAPSLAAKAIEDFPGWT